LIAPLCYSGIIKILVKEKTVLKTMMEDFKQATRLLYYKFLVAFVVLSSSGGFYAANVQAASNLLVTPTRVVFESRDRSAQVTLMNQGDETGNFRISFIRQQMTEDGQFVPVKEGESGKFSDEMIRYSPRQVTLEPGQSQVVRLLVRKKRDLEEGEYRSHMLFQALPNPKKTNVEKLEDSKSNAIKVEILPVVGITIPIIVRHGNLSADVKLSQVKMIDPNKEKARPSISLLMTRKGNASVYGDFKAVFTPVGGEPTVVGQIVGVAVYTPNAQRRFNIPLQVPPDFKLANGELHITYTKTGETPGTGLLAEARIQL
jgi:P pilus assembly chaperone PapD